MEERIPLLSQRVPGDGTAGVGGGEEEDGGGDRWWSGVAREAGKVGSMMLPLAAMSVAQSAVQVASNMMVGHLPGVLPLSASAIATSLASVSGFSLLVGMASGLETLSGQAYGAKQYDKQNLDPNRFSGSCKATCSPPTMEAFRGVVLFLRLALPSALMLCFEWWSFEILILLSGLLPNPELESSVLSICLTTTSLMYNIPYGLGGAASTRVANELGAGNPEGARSVVHLVMSIAGTEAVLVTGALLASQRILGYAYSSDKEVVTYFTSMVPLVCISVAADSLQGVLSDLR
ncbi:hypothetical protein GUJ93_ZPchr0375g18698 [Zizania palustris]|uniref:Protein DETOXIFICATION n=1 Tax=Zizania palustris TaxID=103762 RepID=A0A8J5VUH9_ZIZPA|nr:hypothetical protein GUJ93_ZPchr0375g18698 [Zizania palustris]